MIHTPRGVLLNNPMNIEENSIDWIGQVKPTSDPDNFLADFDTMANGVHAGAKNLRNQQFLHNLNTWRAIITKYAPPATNNTAAYIAAICEATGVGPDDLINLHDPAFLRLSCVAIIVHEQGYNPCTDADLAQGIALALA